jgi:hypothetical protein
VVGVTEYERKHGMLQQLVSFGVHKRVITSFITR